MAPTLDLGLISILREALEILLGERLFGELLADTHGCSCKCPLRSVEGLCARFFTLIQCGDFPPRYSRSRRFETNPSSPRLQAARNRSGPTLPVSKGLMKIPSGWLRRSRSRLALRIDNGSCRTSPPSTVSTLNAQNCTAASAYRKCSALKSAIPSMPEMTASPSMTNCLRWFRSAASATRGCVRREVAALVGPT
jgi:hypothetical protein